MVGSQEGLRELGFLNSCRFWYAAAFLILYSPVRIFKLPCCAGLLVIAGNQQHWVDLTRG